MSEAKFAISKPARVAIAIVAPIVIVALIGAAVYVAGWLLGMIGHVLASVGWQWVVIGTVVFCLLGLMAWFGVSLYQVLGESKESREAR